MTSAASKFHSQRRKGGGASLLRLHLPCRPVVAWQHSEAVHRFLAMLSDSKALPKPDLMPAVAAVAAALEWAGASLMTSDGIAETPSATRLLCKLLKALQLLLAEVGWNG